MAIEKGDILERVLPEDYLELVDGVVVRSLVELVEALGRLSEADFRLHVYGEHNDFAEWVMEAYWDEEVAGKIFGVRSRGKMIRILEKVLRKAGEKSERRIVAPKGRREVLKEIGEVEV